MSSGALVVNIIIEVAVSVAIVAACVLICYCCCCKKKPFYPKGDPIPKRPPYVELEKNPSLTEITKADSSTNGVYRLVLEGGWYEGPLVNGVMQGEGKFCYVNNGGSYLGGFKNNVRHGKGVYSNPQGERFEGIFEEDQSREGTYWYSDENRRIANTFGAKGQFIGGFKLNGHGLQVLQNRSVYEGEYLNNLANGEMKVYLAPGEVFTGVMYEEWANNGKEGQLNFRGEGMLYREGKWKHHGGLSFSKTSTNIRVQVVTRPDGGGPRFEPIN